MAESGEVIPTPDSFGKDMEPSIKDATKGKIGNGTWKTKDLAAMRQVRADKRMEHKDEVEAAYFRGVQDALTPAGQFVGNLIDEGQKIMQRRAEGDRLTSSDMQLLKMAHKAAEDVANRQLGKAVARTESKNETSILGLFLSGESS